MGWGCCKIHKLPQIMSPGDEKKEKELDQHLMVASCHEADQKNKEFQNQLQTNAFLTIIKNKVRCLKEQMKRLENRFKTKIRQNLQRTRL